MKKTVIKVNINCQTCKSDVLRAVTKLSGIDEVSVDGQKGLLSVTGEVDPVMVVKKLRKAGKAAEVVSVGPKKKDEGSKKSPERIIYLPPSCKDCQLVGVGVFDPYYDGRLCTIL